MSKKPPHGASTIEASDDGDGKMKWLLGAGAAVVLLGGGYFAWQTMNPRQDNTEIAYTDPASDNSYYAAPLPGGVDANSESSALDDNSTSAAPAAPRTQTQAGTQRARAQETPEETIGVTPINAGVTDSDDIVVTAARRPIWARTPSARRLSTLYPVRALERGREGEARLACTVQNGGALDCERLSATPGGFGNAALRVAHTFRHADTLADGSTALGSPVNLRVVFRLEDEGRRRG
ncbi:MAG: hypothetical protein R3C25_14385 [Hyphomonadaceae bacterium]